MTSFADRKAARVAQQKADAGKTFKYRVRCTHYGFPADVDPVLPGLFADKKDAERFAFEKLPGAPVGYTGAVRAINERLGRTRAMMPDGCPFAIDRVEV